MKASVIIPTRNRAYVLKHCLKHILNQSFSEYEIIVIDDNSNDTTSDLISEFAKTNSQLKYIRLEKRMGPYVARNAGIKAANGEIIIFLDSDVLVHRDFIKDHITIHNKYQDIILQGMVSHIKDVKKATFKFFNPSPIFFGFLISQNTSIKKDWIIKAGLFDDSLGAPLGFKDMELGIRLEKLGLKFKHGIRRCKAYHIDLPHSNLRFQEYILKYFERGKSAYFFVKKHGAQAEKITHTKMAIARSKLLNTKKWVEKPSFTNLLISTIDSPIRPLFKALKSVTRYHYYAKGIIAASHDNKK